MSSQLASLTSQFEEFKRKDKPSSQKDSILSQEQSMCAPASQSRPEASEGEVSDEDSLPSRKQRRSRSPQGEGDSQQELDPSYVEMLNAIRGLLDLEVPQVECLVAPSAFSKKPTKQVVRKQNLALPPVQDIQTMWEYRFRKDSGTTLKDKASSESLSQGHFYCVNTSYPMDNCLSGRRRPARQTPEKDVLCFHRLAGPSTVHSPGGAWYLLPV